VSEEVAFDCEVCVAGELLETVADDMFVKEAAPALGDGFGGTEVTSATSWYTICVSFVSNNTSSPLTVAACSPRAVLVCVSTAAVVTSDV
jgi:hypothetical protein